MTGRAVETFLDICKDKLGLLLLQSIDLFNKNITNYDVYIICACLISIFLILIPVVVASGQRDPNLIDWLDDRESIRTPMGIQIQARKVIDIPRPNDQTRNRELAEIIFGQMLTNEIKVSRTNLYADSWLTSPFYLDPVKKAELHRIAFEAKNTGDLAKLGLDITTTRTGGNIITGDNTYLTIRDRPGPDIAFASINVYLLVIGKATPENRNRFLAQNPQYSRMYR